MIKLWVWKVQSGLNVIEDVPLRYRDAVIAELNKVAQNG